jgi:DNA-directed RNA polymerase sigma subunit (sigma70/sigma32)|tara:strand:+ start:1211 stop:1453 length:243 start_codon:yes stop_codon:yes gene_type:complete
MKECAAKCYFAKTVCQQAECRLHLDYEEDLNCTLIAIQKHGPMTLEEIGKRHHVSTVRAKQILDATLLKLKKTFFKENTI